MNALEKRPLCLILCIMLGAFSLFINLGWLERLIAVGSLALLIALSFIFRDLFKGRQWLVRLGSAAVCLTILLAGVFEHYVIPKENIDTRAEIEGLVTEVTDTSSHSRNITIETELFNGDSKSYKVILTTYDYDVIELAPGDYISFKADIVNLSKEDKGLYSASYYLSRGYTYRIKNLSNVFLVEHRGLEFDLIKEFRSRLSQKLIDLTDSSTGGLLAALILGDQDYLDPNTKLSFSLIGITHILALSGAHLVMLSEALKRLCQLFGMNKKAVYLLTIIFSILYTILTGCAASIVRAMVMLIITNTLFLLEKPHDSYTTIPLAVVIIILFNPRSVFDLGLWLSAFATLGLVYYSDTQADRETPMTVWGKILLFLKDSVISTFFAIGATLFITVFNFDYISIFSPITTLLFNYPITLIIYGGVIMLFLPFQTPLSYLVQYLTYLVQLVADKISSIDWAIISTDFFSVEVLTGVFTFAFFVLLIFNTQKRRLVALVLSMLLILPFGLGIVMTAQARTHNVFEYQCTETADKISLITTDEVSLLYNGVLNIENAEDEVKALEEMNIVFVDKLVLTCYDKPLTSFVYTFISRIKTGEVYLPSPESTKEAEIATEIAATLSRFSTSIILYDIGDEVSIGDSTLTMRARHPFGGYNASQAVFDFDTSGKSYTYFSLGAFTLLGYEAEDIFYNSEYVIFGNYGSGFSVDVIHDIISPNIKEIYLSPHITFVRYAYNYYLEKGASIKTIDALSILFR